MVISKKVNFLKGVNGMRKQNPKHVRCGAYVLVDKRDENRYSVHKMDEKDPTTSYGEEVMSFSVEQAKRFIAPTIIETTDYNGMCVFAIETVCEDSVVNDDMVVCEECWRAVE